MKAKNNLYNELNINLQNDDADNVFNVDINVIKQKTALKLNSAYTERKIITMKSTKKISFIVIAAALALGITAFAASGIVSNWISSSSSKPDYNTLPTAQRVIKDIGYEPVLIDGFKNGYKFKDGNIVKNNLTDENGKTVEKFKSVSFDYEKDGDKVIFSQDKFISQSKPEGNIVKTVNGTDIYFYSYTNKSVPADYKLTDADKKAEANGELVFSYGSAKTEIYEIQSVTWAMDGMQYQLMQIDGKLSVGELLNMAYEVMAHTQSGNMLPNN